MHDQTETPLADHVRRALDIMAQGPRMLLDSVPGDRSMMASSFNSKVAMDIAGQVQAKDGAYRERNQLVALLASVFPAGIKRTAIEGWSPDWHGCVYVDLPNGQASWHYHDSEAHLFAHLPAYEGEWDGHTTEQKYERIAELTKGRATRPVEWLTPHPFDHPPHRY